MPMRDTTKDFGQPRTARPITLGLDSTRLRPNVATLQEDAVMRRALLCGYCLIGVYAGGATAQTMPSDNPIPARTPATTKPAAKVPAGNVPVGNVPVGDIPEVIGQPARQTQPNAASAPAAVLTPPVIDLHFLRAIRLDWDSVGTTR